jgi:hypothetical protein
MLLNKNLFKIFFGEIFKNMKYFVKYKIKGYEDECDEFIAGPYKTIEACLAQRNDIAGFEGVYDVYTYYSNWLSFLRKFTIKVK